MHRLTGFSPPNSEFITLGTTGLTGFSPLNFEFVTVGTIRRLDLSAMALPFQTLYLACNSTTQFSQHPSLPHVTALFFEL